VSFKVPVTVLYFSEQDSQYAFDIRDEISRCKKQKEIFDKATDSFVKRSVWVQLYEKVAAILAPSRRAEFEFLEIDLPDGVSRPRCPNCLLQSGVVMPDDGFPKNKPFSIRTYVYRKAENGITKRVVQSQKPEPYCHHCKGRLSLMLHRTIPEGFVLLTDEQLEDLGVTVIGLQNDEVPV